MSNQQILSYHFHFHSYTSVSRTQSLLFSHKKKEWSPTDFLVRVQRNFSQARSTRDKEDVS